MSFFDLSVEPRDAQYGRFASSVLRVLKSAVGERLHGGQSQREIADRLGWHASQLSRVLNGRVSNITIKTVSDVLWACDYEPCEFEASPSESLCSNFEKVCDAHHASALSVTEKAIVLRKFKQADAAGKSMTFWTSHKEVVQL
jgi:transcriptional regulator with XRE-family HTH domain